MLLADIYRLRSLKHEYDEMIEELIKKEKCETVLDELISNKNKESESQEPSAKTLEEKCEECFQVITKNEYEKAFENKVAPAETIEKLNKSDELNKNA